MRCALRDVALAATLLLAALGAGAAPFEPREFASAEHERIYRKLVEELRCLVCQNQNIADSDADLAGDLRREVYEQLAAGASEAEILDFMTARYGDFVLYRPPLAARTVALWAGPAVLLLLGAAIVLVRVRRRAVQAAREPALDAAARRRLADLTGEVPPAER